MPVVCRRPIALAEDTKRFKKDIEKIIREKGDHRITTRRRLGPVRG
jgi:hypothetical protein